MGIPICEHSMWATRKQQDTYDKQCDTHDKQCNKIHVTSNKIHMTNNKTAIAYMNEQ